MSVKRNALIVGGGMAALLAYAHLLTPIAPIPPTPADMVKIEGLTSDFAIANGDPFSSPPTITHFYWPRSLIRIHNQGAQPVFTCPSGTAEKDLMEPVPATQRSNFTGSTTRSLPEAMFLLIRSSDLTVQPFTCPSGTAERDPTSAP